MLTLEQTNAINSFLILPNNSSYFKTKSDCVIIKRQSRMIDGMPFYDLEGNGNEWTKGLLVTIPNSAQSSRRDEWRDNSFNSNMSMRIDQKHLYCQPDIDFHLVWTRQ